MYNIELLKKDIFNELLKDSEKLEKTIDLSIDDMYFPDLYKYSFEHRYYNLEKEVIDFCKKYNISVTLKRNDTSITFKFNTHNDYFVVWT